MIKLYNDEYLNVIESIPDKSIDLLLTDPPYLHVKGGMKSKRINVGDVYREDCSVVTDLSDFGKEKIYEFLDAVKRKMKKINMFIFCSKLQVIHYLNWAASNKLQYDILFWYKDTKKMISTKFFATNVEYIIRIYGSGASLKPVLDENEKAICDYYQKLFIMKTPRNRVYPTQKPIELLERLLKVSSLKGDIVLDPFMGSGTTGIACKYLGRSFIGIEKESDIFKLAEERIGITDDE